MDWNGLVRQFATRGYVLDRRHDGQKATLLWLRPEHCSLWTIRGPVDLRIQQEPLQLKQVNGQLDRSFPPYLVPLVESDLRIIRQVFVGQILVAGQRTDPTFCAVCTNYGCTGFFLLKLQRISDLELQKIDWHNPAERIRWRNEHGLLNGQFAQPRLAVR